MRILRVAALALSSLLGFGCQSAPGGGTPESAAPPRADAPRRVIERGGGGVAAKPKPAPQPSRVEAISVYDGEVIEGSLALAGGEPGWIAAFEGRDGRAYVSNGLGVARKVAERARVGCVRASESGFVLATLERSHSLPVHHLVLHRLSAEGAPVGQPERVDGIWADAGSRCVFTSETGLVLRGRAAQPDSVMDLWWVEPGKGRKNAGFDVHVPSIRGGVSLPEGGAVLEVEQVVALDDTKVMREELIAVGPGGDFEAMPDVLLGDALSVFDASDARLVAARFDAEGGRVAWTALSSGEPNMRDVAGLASVESLTLRAFELSGASWAMLTDVEGVSSPTLVSLEGEPVQGGVSLSVRNAQVVVLPDGEVVVVGEGAARETLQDVSVGLRGVRGLRGADGLTRGGE